VSVTRLITYAKHTPGPWGVTPGDGRYIVGAAGDEVIASVEGQNQAVDEANALLIAAAPELLDALRKSARALKGAHRNTYIQDAINAVEAAIAKAEGRS